MELGNVAGAIVSHEFKNGNNQDKKDKKDKKDKDKQDRESTSSSDQKRKSLIHQGPIQGARSVPILDHGKDLGTSESIAPHCN